MVQLIIYEEKDRNLVLPKVNMRNIYEKAGVGGLQ